MAVVVIAGSSGFLGSALTELLSADGHEVRRLVRRPARAQSEISWDPSTGHLPDEALTGASAVVNFAGVGVGDRRWSPTRRQAILTSRVAPTTLLATRIAATGRTDLSLVNASAVGFYGDRGEEQIDEGSTAGASFLATVCQAWEAAADPARAAGARVVHLRTGIVLDAKGGALTRMLPLLKLGLAGPLGDGGQWWPWITREDVLKAIEHLLLRSTLHGPVNLTAPHPERNRDVMTALASAVGRPAVLPVPAFALRLALGGFAGELLASQRVIPSALLGDGFTFTWPELDRAAKHLLGD
ncbi:TIGR01777 family oxidoreductase [Ruania halotolerans]|uniref:TIGR01777 family oxidoreductase n=1 Tax=Ruania halotolerans TaxID=2897773 RepID=UPI001E63E3FC|nr:TIGR01777 family oxidoreductase [Ruania halotolerans]UFU04850.1 TIGR01777 family oxidoreductase [Ruania halotolerans]